MSDQFWPQSWRLLAGARGVGLLLRILIAVAPVAALVCTRVAAPDTVVAIEVVVVLAAVFTAVAPDSHLGLLVLLSIAIDWWVAVDDPASPWSIGVALSLTVFHASAAAASVVPPSAAWTRAMARRWVQHGGMVACGSAAVWAVVAAVDGRHVAGGQLLVAGALIAVSAGALWARGSAAA